MITLVLGFWMALSLVYSIPSTAMTKHLNESEKLLDQESISPIQYAAQRENAKYDNYTVYHMLNLAAHSGGNPFVESLASKNYFLSEDFPAALQKAIEGESNHTYPRYWHGYLVFLKPLLVFFNIREIRLLCQVFFFALLALVVGCLSRRSGSGLGAGVVLTVSFCLFGAAQAAETLPIFSSFALSLMGCLWILFLSKRKIYERKSNLFSEDFILLCSFGVFGALTVYFDFLDNPILTLCVPLALYLYLEKHAMTMRRMLKIGFCSLIGWGAGYGLLWLGKWLLAEVVTGVSVLNIALEQVKFRSGASDLGMPESGGPLKAVMSNFASLGFVRYILLFVCFCALVCVAGLAIRTRIGREDEHSGHALIATCIGLILISTVPYLWYMAVSNHSIVHASFITYRTQIGAFFPWLMIVFLTLRSYIKSLRRKSSMASDVALG